jgi:SAM-dependent methyltransferase
MQEHPHEEDALRFQRTCGECVELGWKLLVPDGNLFALLIARQARSGLAVENGLIGFAMNDSLPETFYDDLKPQLRSRIARAVSGAGKIVDLGCGNCDLAFFLAESNEQEVIGVDISDADFPQETEVMRANTGSVRCVKEDARALSFLDADSVDAVVSVWALHEMASPLSVLREARRILRPGGQVLIVDFPRNSLAQRLWSENYFDLEEVAGMLRKAGFAAVHCKAIAHGQIIWARGEKNSVFSREPTKPLERAESSGP